MGEYQFYDFLALDQRLSADQRAELRGLSSRATITATSFTNHYDFGDFHGDPDRLVDRYFDAHLHLAEWGSREVVLKVPATALPLAEAEQYTSETIVSARSVPGATVVAVRIGPDDPGASDDDLAVWDAEGDRQGWGYGGWDEADTAGSGTLTIIADARDLILAGDRRLLYLSWLVAVARGEVVLQPPTGVDRGRGGRAHRSSARRRAR